MKKLTFIALFFALFFSCVDDDDSSSGGSKSTFKLKYNLEELELSGYINQNKFIDFSVEGKDQSFQAMFTSTKIGSLNHNAPNNWFPIFPDDNNNVSLPYFPNEDGLHEVTVIVVNNLGVDKEFTFEFEAIDIGDEDDDDYVAPKLFDLDYTLDDLRKGVSLNQKKNIDFTITTEHDNLKEQTFQVKFKSDQKGKLNGNAEDTWFAITPNSEGKVNLTFLPEKTGTYNMTIHVRNNYNLEKRFSFPFNAADVAFNLDIVDEYNLNITQGYDLSIINKIENNASGDNNFQFRLREMEPVFNDDDVSITYLGDTIQLDSWNKISDPKQFVFVLNSTSYGPKQFEIDLKNGTGTLTKTVQFNVKQQEFNATVSMTTNKIRVNGTTTMRHVVTSSHTDVAEYGIRISNIGTGDFEVSFYGEVLKFGEIIPLKTDDYNLMSATTTIKALKHSEEVDGSKLLIEILDDFGNVKREELVFTLWDTPTVEFVNNEAPVTEIKKVASDDCIVNNSRRSIKYQARLVGRPYGITRANFYATPAVLNKEFNLDGSKPTNELYNIETSSACYPTSQNITGMRVMVRDANDQLATVYYTP